MKSVSINGNLVKLYDSIDELPISQFQNYQRYLLIDSGIGSDVNDIAAHINTIRKLVKSKQEEKADRELINLMQNIVFCVKESNPKLYSFCCLIHSINGKELNDFSQDNLNLTIKQLSKKGLTIGKVKSILKSVKKKSTLNLNYFSRK